MSKEQEIKLSITFGSTSYIRDGYAAAFEFDHAINEMLEKFPIAGEFQTTAAGKNQALEYMKFARTIRTTCELIEKQAERVWKERKATRALK